MFWFSTAGMPFVCLWLTVWFLEFSSQFFTTKSGLLIFDGWRKEPLLSFLVFLKRGSESEPKQKNRKYFRGPRWRIHKFSVCSKSNHHSQFAFCPRRKTEITLKLRRCSFIIVRNVTQKKAAKKPQINKTGGFKAENQQCCLFSVTVAPSRVWTACCAFMYKWVANNRLNT